MNTKKRIYIDLDAVIVDLIAQMKIELETTTKQYTEKTDLIDDSHTVFLNAHKTSY